MRMGDENWYDVIVGDCVKGMQTLEAGSVHTCVTSPPYFGLRDYQMDGQIGLEDTPEAYVARLVEVFREVRRVLRDDGTLWLNIGDSYARGFGGGSPGAKSSTNVGAFKGRKAGRVPAGLSQKDLIGIPWRVAFALQADGWCLRQDIIWYKPNPMPESVKDRCTKAHEYIFLLSKSPRYYFDSAAIREPEACGRKRGPALHPDAKSTNGNGGLARRESDGFRNRRSVWTVTTKPYKGAHFATFPPDLIEPCILAGCPPGGAVLDPFGGSGTTAGVALKHGRNAILCELNPDYDALIDARVDSIRFGKK
jgi:site-specific DNA-methyltransferase (adenine-specific)